MTREKNPSNIFDKERYADLRISLDDVQGKSARWFQARVAELKGITSSQIMKNQNEFRNLPKYGEIYCYWYDAKTKENLPYYDMFPIVLPLRLYPGGFLGCNFHYIKPEHRMILLQEIKKHGRGPKATIITYDIIADFAKSKYAEPTIKRYLYEQMGTPFRRIDAKDIVTALIVPTEKFVGAKKTEVWRDYRKF